MLNKLKEKFEEKEIKFALEFEREYRKINFLD